jgi:phosphatidylglycerophosphatase A
MKHDTSFTTLLRHPAYLLAFGGGAGLAPKAPGTVGSLVALPLYLLLLPLTSAIYIALVAALFLLGVWACARTERDLGVHDHPGIVWDEIVGMLVTLFLAPAGCSSASGCSVFSISGSRTRSVG